MIFSDTGLVLGTGVRIGIGIIGMGIIIINSGVIEWGEETFRVDLCAGQLPNGEGFYKLVVILKELF